MTATKRTRKDARGKPGPGYDLEQKNALTREEVNRLLDTIYDELANRGEEEPPAAFLLLLNAVVFEEDSRERFAVWADARSKFALEFRGAYHALEASLGAALAGLRKGGAQ